MNAAAFYCNRIPSGASTQRYSFKLRDRRLYRVQALLASKGFLQHRTGLYTFWSFYRMYSLLVILPKFNCTLVYTGGPFPSYRLSFRNK
jgi:hypothetical protein